LVWVLFSLFGALPFYLSGYFNSFTDAFFESMSGFSTTGSSVLVDVEILSKGILFWRSLIQWLGGMGIILLSLAIMPMLKIGNYQLLTAEVPGPVYDKIHPRVTVAARRLWFLYSGLTILLVVLLRLGGMSLFDSICHSLTTMATGGFSTKNASIAHWDSAYIEGVTVLFMFLAGTSFVLLYRVFSGKFYKIKQNEEFKAYFYIVLVSGLVLSTALFFFADLSPVKALRTGFFSGGIHNNHYRFYNGRLQYLGARHTLFAHSHHVFWSHVGLNLGEYKNWPYSSIRQDIAQRTETRCSSQRGLARILQWKSHAGHLDLRLVRLFVLLYPADDTQRGHLFCHGPQHGRFLRCIPDQLR
jgi:hypothetical protein